MQVYALLVLLLFLAYLCMHARAVIDQVTK